MQGRMGMALVLVIAGVLAVGCAGTKQKQAAQDRKMAHAQTKADDKQKKADAKHMAREDKARRAEEMKMAEANRREDMKMEKEQRQAIGADMIRDEREVRIMDRFAQGHAAAGAREDAMLSDAHFDGGELNSLGRGKLALIAQSASRGSAQPVMVYVGGAGEVGQARIASAQAYWKASPYGDLPLQLKPGVNDNLTTPAKSGIDGLKKMEQSARTAGGGTASGTDTTGGRGRSGAGTSSNGASTP